jgi:hypothetical protein
MDDFDFYVILRPVDKIKTKFYRVYAFVKKDNHAHRQLLVERDCTGLKDNQWIIERFTLRLDKTNAKVNLVCEANDGSLEIYEVAYNGGKFFNILNTNLYSFNAYQIDFNLTCS